MPLLFSDPELSSYLLRRRAGDNHSRRFSHLVGLMEACLRETLGVSKLITITAPLQSLDFLPQLFSPARQDRGNERWGRLCRQMPDGGPPCEWSGQLMDASLCLPPRSGAMILEGCYHHLWSVRQYRDMSPILGGPNRSNSNFLDLQNLTNEASALSKKWPQ
jgi:hypothetical protein